MKTKLVQIGNSQGVRIPRPLLEQAGLEGEVRLRIVESGIIIEGAARPRAGWATAAELARSRGESELLDDDVPTVFDDTEWQW
jgi:antitoxin MazE